MDQSFIVYNLFVNNACDSQLMKKYVYLSEHIPPPFPSSYTDLTFIHFVWPIGNPAHKLYRMMDHFRNLLNNYTIQSKSIGDYSVTDIIGKKYTWDTTNIFIEFGENSILNTINESGIYIQLDKYTIEITLKSEKYILKINNIYDSYVGFNKTTFDCISGKLI
jgi:hypothetical protein